MPGYGIASGLLSGLSGLPRGMQQADELNLQRERLAEQQRQFDQSRATDTSSIGIPGMTPNALIPYLASLAKTKEEAARKAALGQDIAGQLRAMGTTTSMAPGASVEMPQPGGLMAPPAPGPMPAMTQQTVDPKMAALAKLLPGLLQTHPETAGAMLKDVFIPPKPVSLAENATLVDPRDGKPIGPAPAAPAPFTPPANYEPSYTQNQHGRVSTTWKKPDEVRTPYTRQDIEAELRLEGLTPGTLAWQKRYNDKARQIMVAPGGEIRGAGTGLGGGPIPTPVPPNAGPPSIAPGTEPVPSSTPRGGGGSGALYERPPNPEMATHYLNRNTWQPPPPGTTMSQIQRSGEYVQIPTARVNSLSQGRVVKGMLDELESIIVKRPDLFPLKTAGTGGQGGMLDDILSLGKAKGYSMIPGAKDYDPDLARLSSLSITLPSAVKAFGDTANIAVKEREIAEQATGLRPGMQDAALARVDLIRRMINDSIQTAGMPPFPSLRTGTAPAAATMPPGAAPGAGTKGETLSRRDPRYQQLRQRGLSDQQIQQQFGVSIGD